MGGGRGAGEGVLAVKSDTPQFQFWLCLRLAVWLPASHFTSLNLRFLTCRKELTTV